MTVYIELFSTPYKPAISDKPSTNGQEENRTAQIIMRALSVRSPGTFPRAFESLSKLVRSPESKSRENPLQRMLAD